MPDLPAPVASAVVVPKQDAPNVKSPRRKRRQSSVSEEASKRPRISTEGSVGSPSTLHSSPQATDSLKHESSGKTQRLTVVPEGSRNVNPERRRSSVQEERKRGQRLFGGLLNTLNQSTPNGQQKKRQEIEARQKERAAQRKVEAEVKRKEKLANLRAVRMVEQVKFQEESMRIRHTNMLAMAGFLSTETEPKLYYKPWQLSVRNEATIKAQIEKVEILIEEEKSEWARQHQEQGLKVEEEFEVKVMSDVMMGEPHTEPPSSSNIDTTNPISALVAQSSQVKTEKDNLEEHNGEVVVEAEEDTVIY
ncbi:hypothetical protein sscle_14g097760 [Sclerotinia sclerotiorum 1980 UF-70]|uniref:Pinin/SDK/MemA protein domain-containing protein n=1 Tax=Sclerotinia sclerotiorum (strain ATCC 18683 / 1980 / Ss-1) TaxID=665079 RepID=A0A1D9QJ98_SCLS1|nr:hypothetical protein sscle_14g097760 [Sclerotinia sclerotiorum 1980 UF-70]